MAETSIHMIPAEAVEAAQRVAYERYGSRPDTAYLRTILEAAAPHMLAGAWLEGYGSGELDGRYDANGHEEPNMRNPYRPTP